MFTPFFAVVVDQGTDASKVLRAPFGTAAGGA
jgi:hypothetical protein